MARNTVVELKDCPFCGAKEDTLYAGPHSSLSFGVKCKCGAMVVEEMPNTYTKAEKKEIEEFVILHNVTSLQAIAIFHTLNAIEKWNRRK